MFKWRRRQTAHFGPYWFPLATIQLESSNGLFVPISVQIDSGAVISLLPRSIADLLGLAIFAGRKIEVRSVGGAITVAYVHSLKARFSGETATTIRFAIADSEHVPSLLGRLDIFEHFRIDFDPTLKQTSITFPG